MADFYVRRNGSDAAAGTSAGAAWATIGKALGASGIASGDRVFIGAGVYRELVTVAVTPTATTAVVGDVTGEFTGDAGEVRWTALQTEFNTASAFTPVNLGSKNFLAFSNIVFQAGEAPMFSSFSGHDISFTDCAFFSNGGMFAGSLTVDAAANLTFDRCYFYHPIAGALFAFTLPTSLLADYDVNILFRNCLVLSIGAFVSVTASGVLTFKGGGVDVRSCTVFARTGIFAVNSANVATSIPCTVYDSILQNPTGSTLVATTSGQILEDYNLIASADPRTLVAIGAHSSRLASINSMFHLGQERIWGGQPRPFGTPMPDSLANGWGSQSGGPTVDLSNRPRSAGAAKVKASGTATAGAATTLTDSGATWGTNQKASMVCKITGGTGSGQAKLIKSNTGTVLTFFGNWKTNPDSTSTYVIYLGGPAETFTCTSGSTTTAVQSSASWTTNMWAGFAIEITAGTGSGQTTTVTSNTSTTLTMPTLATGLDATSQCVLYRQTSINAVNKTVGALARHDTAEKETGTTDAGSVGLVLTGWADHAVHVPVDASSTTITVRARYNATHGTTNKPQAVLDANGEVGVSTETQTMTAAADTWETLTFSAFTPSGKGWVTIRLLSRADAVTGRAYFDTLSVT